MMMALGEVAFTCSATCLTMPALVLSRSSRDIRLARDAGGDDDYVGAGGLVVAVRADDTRIEALNWSGLPLIETLPLRDSLDDVDHDDGPSKLFFRYTLRGRRADVSGTDDRDFVDHVGFVG